MATARIKVTEIMERLNVSNATVYELLNRGEIPAIRLNRVWIISRYAYEQWERTFGTNRAKLALKDGE